MKKIVHYNFDNEVNLDTNWKDFFSTTRRDANFAAVFETAPNEYIAIRDHLGTIPLYYKVENRKTTWSMSYDTLSPKRDNLTSKSIEDYLGFPTSKISTLDSKIKIVSPGSVLKVTQGTIEILYTYKMSIRPHLGSREHIKDQLTILIEQAVERTIKEPSVGLYLSGGMDSGLLGSILRKKGIEINAYTALPWGKNGTEYRFSKDNSDSIKINNHTFIDVDPSKYNYYLESLKDLYKTPNGSATAINVTSLWKETNIKNEKQVFFAQNTDTLASSVAAQSHTIVTSFLPKSIRELLANMPHDKAITNYLHFCSQGHLSTHPYEEYVNEDLATNIQIAQAGMYIAHTPNDCESINAPSIANSQLCSNPYYDMDLIEFYLGIETKHKISFNWGVKTKISFEKNLFREIALNYLPKELVYRKKGFTLPQDRDREAAIFYNNLPKEFLGVKAKNNYEKLSLQILLNNINT